MAASQCGQDFFDMLSLGAIPPCGGTEWAAAITLGSVCGGGQGASAALSNLAPLATKACRAVTQLCCCKVSAISAGVPCRRRIYAVYGRARRAIGTAPSSARCAPRQIVVSVRIAGGPSHPMTSRQSDRLRVNAAMRLTLAGLRRRLPIIPSLTLANSSCMFFRSARDARGFPSILRLGEVDESPPMRGQADRIER